MDIDELWDFSDAVASETRFRAALESDTGHRVELLTQLARAKGLQRKFEQARETLREAARDAVKGTRQEVRYLLELGRVENSSGNKDVALPLFLGAYELAKSLGEDNLAVDAAHMVAIAEEPLKQLKWNMLALDLARASKDPKANRWQASLYNNIGWTLHDSGALESALEMFENAVPLREASGNEKALRIAKWCVGRCLRSLGRNDEAMQIQRVLEAAGSTDFVYEEIAELLHIANDDGAQQYFKLAYEDLSKDEWLAAKEPERLARLKALGGL